MKRLNDEEQEKLRRIAKQQKIPSATMKSKQSSSLSAFYRKGKEDAKEKQEIEALRKKYLGEKQKSWFEPEE